MRQNSFQKNGLLNVNNVSSNNAFGGNTNQLGRRTVEDIKKDMFNAKQNGRNFKQEDVKNNSFNNNQSNMQNRIDYLKKMDNMNRWK